MYLGGLVIIHLIDIVCIQNYGCISQTAKLGINPDLILNFLTILFSIFAASHTFLITCLWLKKRSSFCSMRWP